MYMQQSGATNIRSNESHHHMGGRYNPSHAQQRDDYPYYPVSTGNISPMHHVSSGMGVNHSQGVNHSTQSAHYRQHMNNRNQQQHTSQKVDHTVLQSRPITITSQQSRDFKGYMRQDYPDLPSTNTTRNVPRLSQSNDRQNMPRLSQTSDRPAVTNFTIGEGHQRYQPDDQNHHYVSQFSLSQKK